jgi:DNA invertase Pin-like site-specific DNA recombinase
LEAQRAAVEGYLNGGRWTLVAEYVEAESGKRSDRPKLAKALAHAKAIGATVVFAKLDRLSRNVDLLRKLVASDVDLVFCDLPHVPPGAMGRFLLTQMASVVELEAGPISERTKAALAAAKARGVKLGNPNGARALHGKQIGNADAVAAVKANAAHRAETLRGIVADLSRQRHYERPRLGRRAKRAWRAYAAGRQVARNINGTAACSIGGINGADATRGWGIPGRKARSPSDHAGRRRGSESRHDGRGGLCGRC